MKLTKTQNDLIELAKAHNGRVAAEWATGRGPEGGRVSHGARAHKALQNLIKAGLMVRVDSYSTALPEGGYTIRVNTLVAKLAN